MVDDLEVGPSPDKREHYQSGRESLDRTDHATSVARTNSAIHGLVNGRSVGRYASGLWWRLTN